MVILDKYEKTDIQGRTYEYSLWEDNSGSAWTVQAWECINKDTDEWDFLWEVKGINHADGWKPFTKEEALAEFERWRS